MKVKAYKSYTARKANELSLAVDDIIEVEDKTSIDLWKGKLENGNSGLFPTNCVLPLDGDTTPLSDKSDSDKKMPFKQLKQIGAKKDSAPATANSRQPPLESTLSGSTEVAPKLPPKPVREQVRVIYGYKAQNEDELTIKEGDIITVIAKDSEDAGWWKGELNGRIALFPDNFVEVIHPSPPPTMPRPAENADKLRVKKPDRNATATAVTVSRTNSGSSPSPLATDSASPTNNALASVPLIGKMLKFTQSNSNTNSQSSPHKSSDSVPQSSSVSNTNGVASKASAEPSDSSPTDDDKDKEDPFNAEPLSPSKLVHLTAQRPKIPSNSRRPPSLIIGKGTEFTDFMDSQEEAPESPPVTAARQSTDANKVMQSTVGIALKPVHRPEPESGSSPEKKAPWLSELKKSQERRRTNEQMSDRQKPLNGPAAAPTPSVKPHAPTPPGAKPFVSNSTKPNLVSAQSAPTNTTSTNVSLSAVESPPIIAEASSLGANNKPASSVASNSESSQPVIAKTSVPATTTTSDANNANVLAQAEEMTKMRNEINELSGTVAELRITVADLRKELAQQSASHKSQTEWTQQKADLENQLQEQQAFFEGHKKNLTDMVKELINELAEEKKKIAGLQIELDRMRKLTTTV